MEYYSGMQRWNTVIYNHMDESWEYYIKQNKSDEKG